MNTRRMHRPALRLAAAGFGLSLVLGAAACGADDTTGGDARHSPAAETTPADSPQQTGPGPDDAPTEPTDPAAEAGDLTATALRAIATAEEETGGTAYEIDDQDGDGRWEVDVRVGDRSVEVTVSADGDTVEGTEDDELDDDDRAGLDRAGITLAEAIETAVGEAGGVLDDAELEEDDDIHFWEVTVDGTDRGDDVEVKVDVTTGQVVEVDD